MIVSSMHCSRRTPKYERDKPLLQAQPHDVFVLRCDGNVQSSDAICGPAFEIQHEGRKRVIHHAISSRNFCILPASRTQACPARSCFRDLLQNQSFGIEGPSWGLKTRCPFSGCLNVVVQLAPTQGQSSTTLTGKGLIWQEQNLVAILERLASSQTASSGRGCCGSAFPRMMTCLSLSWAFFGGRGLGCWM